MKGRPLYWLPDLVVEGLTCCPGFRHLWSEAFLEQHARAVDAAEAEANEDGGPWLVTIPRGLH